MPSEETDWKDITPDSLLSAVSHIRERFEEVEFSLDFQTQQLCFKELHPFAPSKSPSAIFKRCMDVYQLGLNGAVEKQFRDLLEIGLANAHLLRSGPVEWAKSHLELLITGKQYRVRLWIKNVCDRQEMPKGTTPEEMEEFDHWRSWRAPKLIHMQPSGNTPYDPATAWSRENEDVTERLLSGFANRFIDSVVFHLERIAGEAHVQLAKEGRQSAQPALQKSSAKPIEDERPDSNDQTPVAFISYSWDSEGHKKWVLDLACKLQRQGGVRIVLDRWHLAPGGDKAVFMEKNITDSKFVVLICTPAYAERANQRTGGVGYEATIITGEMAENINQGKFIPVLRTGDWKSSLPVWIKTKQGVNLSGNPYSEEEYQELVRALHQAAVKPPPIGPKPDFEKTQIQTDSGKAPLWGNAPTPEIQGKWDAQKVEAFVRSKLVDQEPALRDTFYASQVLSLDHSIVGEYYLRYRDRESMIVVTASIEKGVDCHACAPRLSLFEFERSRLGWTLGDSAIAVTRWGQWGQVAPNDVKVFVVGENIYALFLDGTGMGQGYVSSKTSVQARVGDRYQEILNLQTSADDSGSMLPGAEKWTSTIKIQPGTSGFYDLLVERKGVRDRESFDECERFKFNGQRYVSSGIYG
jgi:hypothetical protein